MFKRIVIHAAMVALVLAGGSTGRAGDTVLYTEDFMADWAASSANGMKFIAYVGGTWYGSDTYGTGAGDHGAAGGGNVTEWEVDVSVNTETNTWYASIAGLPYGYEWRDGIQWSPAPLWISRTLPGTRTRKTAGLSGLRAQRASAVLSPDRTAGSKTEA